MMKDDPEKYWGNIPQEEGTPSPADVPDVPYKHTTQERRKEERQAERNND